MNAYELADTLNKCIDDGSTDLYCVCHAAKMLRQQADRIAELEKEVLMWENVEVPTEVMADLIQELERRKFITTPQIKELSDEEIKPLLDRIQNYLECGGLFNPECMEHDKVRDLIMDCKAILKKASEK